MKILITNDDGHDAQGISVLESVARQFGDVFVVAPLNEQSGCGHGLTFDEPIHFEERSGNFVVVDGTPADCVRLGLEHFCPDADWVFSGVNAGANLGFDVFLSGTVAAAREAAASGVSAIALSQYMKGSIKDWEYSRECTLISVREIISRKFVNGDFWNVNFPLAQLYGNDAALPPVADCPLDHNRLPAEYEKNHRHFQYRGDYHGRNRAPGRDIDRCYSGSITITKMNFFSSLSTDGGQAD